MLKNNSLISVIVPVYNTKAYLGKCIKTIIDQSYKNLEIILIDDGSTDGTSVMCDEWSQKDARIKVFHLQNGGVSKARNFALEPQLLVPLLFPHQNHHDRYNLPFLSPVPQPQPEPLILLKISDARL